MQRTHRAAQTAMSWLKYCWMETRNLLLWKTNYMLLTQFTNQFRFFLLRSNAPCTCTISSNRFPGDFSARFINLMWKRWFFSILSTIWWAEKMASDAMMKFVYTNLICSMLTQIELFCIRWARRRTMCLSVWRIFAFYGRASSAFFFNYGSRCHGIMKNGRENRFFSLSTILRAQFFPMSSGFSHHGKIGVEHVVLRRRHLSETQQQFLLFLLSFAQQQFISGKYWYAAFYVHRTGKDRNMCTASVRFWSMPVCDGLFLFLSFCLALCVLYDNIELFYYSNFNSN